MPDDQAETLEIRAIEVTGSPVGGAPILPDLLDQIPADQPIGRVTADGAYDTCGCHTALAQRGTVASIAPRKNGKPWTEHAARARVTVLEAGTAESAPRNEALRSCSRLGRAIWRRWSDCHRRNRVETWMRRFKLRASGSWPATSTPKSPSYRSGRSRVLSNQWRSPVHF